MECLSTTEVISIILMEIQETTGLHTIPVGQTRKTIWKT